MIQANPNSKVTRFRTSSSAKAWHCHQWHWFPVVGGLHLHWTNLARRIDLRQMCNVQPAKLRQIPPNSMRCVCVGHGGIKSSCSQADSCCQSCRSSKACKTPHFSWPMGLHGFDSTVSIVHGSSAVWLHSSDSTVSDLDVLMQNVQLCAPTNPPSLCSALDRTTILMGKNGKSGTLWNKLSVP